MSDNLQLCTVGAAPRRDNWRESKSLSFQDYQYGLYAPNCNRCRRYHWRSKTCQRQGRVEFTNTPPCGEHDYQPFAPTLAERETVVGAAREGAP